MRIVSTTESYAMSDTFTEITETFEFLDDWEEKYRYVIELGRDYAALDEVLRTDAIKVDGCASQVWMLPKLENDVFSFQGASDAIIVSGLVAILAALYNGKTSAQAREINAIAAFEALGLGQNLSAQRSNGLRSMIQKIADFLERS
jgi:cysteine desulfuration protein SufE